MNLPNVVSQAEAQAAREKFRVQEEEATRTRVKLAAERRRLPMVRVKKEYEFKGTDGTVSLLDLFDGRRQLIIYRFFFEPGVAGWPETGCVGCSMFVDGLAHLAHPRYLPGAGLSRAAGEHRAVQHAHGMDVSLVHHAGRLLRGLRRHRVVWPQRLRSGRRLSLPHLLHRRPRCRSDRQRLEPPRPHPAWPSGGGGRLAGGLPAPPRDGVVPAARRVRRKVAEYRTA